MFDDIADGDASPEWFYRPLQRAGLLWIALVNDSLAGFAACEACDDTLHLHELSVHRDAQGHGLGRALIAAAVAEARRRGLRAVTLTTFREIPWNAPFYERVGFAQIVGADLDARLAAILKREARRGLSGRCAMRLSL
jgi:GNAT superfamily N-acetyltransferase